MAWEELLRLHDDRKEDASLPLPGGEARDKGSLIGQARQLVGMGSGEPDASAGPDEAQAQVICRDGYVRRSPVQPYRTAEDFARRRARKIVTAVVILIVAVLLIYALMKSGLLVFRLR